MAEQIEKTGKARIVKPFSCLTTVAIIGLLYMAGCSGDNKAGQSGQKQATPSAGQTEAANPNVQKVEITEADYEMSNIPFDLNGKPVEIAGIRFTPASQWTDFGPSGMRQASYAYGPLEGDKDSATVAVFYFGKDQGGTIEANLERWIKQFTLPGGGDPHTATIQHTLTVDEMNVHVLTLMGTYHASMGGPMSGNQEAKDNYRMAAMVVEAPGGNVFFKLTGPDYTAKIMIEAYVSMIRAIKRVA